MFCTGMFGALKNGFRSLSTLSLVVDVVGELSTEKKTATTSRGFLATTQLSCFTCKHGHRSSEVRCIVQPRTV